MKFARQLREAKEELPEMDVLFTIYKQLKKAVKHLPAQKKRADAGEAVAGAGSAEAVRADGGADGAGPSADPQPVPTEQARHPEGQSEHDGAGPSRSDAVVEEEARFTEVLTEQLQRLNDRFLEREETCVIQLAQLEAEAQQCFDAAAKALEQAAAGPAAAEEDRACAAAAAAHAAQKALVEGRSDLYKRFVNFHGADPSASVGNWRLPSTGAAAEASVRHEPELHARSKLARAALPRPTPGEVLLLVHWSVLAYTATVKILKKHHKRTGLLLRAPHLGDLLSQPFCSSEVRPRPGALASHIACADAG
jgi:hypothetical protein